MGSSPAIAYMKDEQGRYVDLNRTDEDRFGGGPAVPRERPDRADDRSGDPGRVEAGRGLDLHLHPSRLPARRTAPPAESSPRLPETNN